MFNPSDPVRFQISCNVRKLARALRDAASRRGFALERSPEPLPALILANSTPIYRDLPGVARELFENKRENLRLAIEAVDGVLIRPGEIFSLWSLVGNPSEERGFKPGLVIRSGTAAIGVGGGLCQLSNAIHWLALHSELAVTERHRHSFDIFPDDSRTIPFGTGATIAYNYKDLRFFNPGKLSFQLRFELRDDCLKAELRRSSEPEYRFSVEARDERFVKTPDGIFRSNAIWRIKSASGGRRVSSEHLFSNHCRCQYGEEGIR